MIESRAQMQERKGYTLQDVIVPEKAFPQTREVHKASKTPPSKSLASKAFLLPPSLIVTSENGWPGAPNPTAQPSHPINFEWSLNHLKWKLCPGKNNFKLSLTLSLPEYLMEVCKVPLTFESADEILWWDPFKWNLSACTFTWYHLFFKIWENEIWKSGRNLPLATFGSERVKKLVYGIASV